MLFLLLLFGFQFHSIQGKYHCDRKGYVLAGAYCYYIETDPAYVEAPDLCLQREGHLACWENEQTLQSLLELVTTTDAFDEFFVGLLCDSDTLQWDWIPVEPKIAFTPAPDKFYDQTKDPVKCSYNIDVNERYLLTREGTFKPLNAYQTSSSNSFKPRRAVCQRIAVVDPSDSTTDPGIKDESKDYTILIVGLCIAITILIVFTLTMLIRYRKEIAELFAKNTDDVEEAKSNEYLESARKRTDCWEISRPFVDIVYSEKLGNGAFGIVHLGQIDVSGLSENPERSIIQISELRQNNGRVAVKMLHESSDRLAEIEFLQEIEIMKRIGYHDRLVNMVACITESTPNLLIVEFCSNGDLLKFMKERRQYMFTLPQNADYETIDQSLIITQEQQLQYAVQIAYGMEYLSGRGYIHRDIAARNVLVDAKNGCKIGDFGLCRKVQEEHEFYHSRGGRFPIKWMSPEALKRYEMSTASDVWSFGVLLFEIITLGGSPYPDWETAEVLPRLEAGERMRRPDNCPDSVFEAMSNCWKIDPEARPDFGQLRSRLAKVLEETPSEYYLQLDAQKDYYLVPRSRDAPIQQEDIFRKYL